MQTRAYRPYDDRAPEDPCSVALSAEELEQADATMLAADAVLQAGYAGMTLRQKNYVRRIYWQAQHASIVCAVAALARGGDAGPPGCSNSSAGIGKACSRSASHPHVCHPQQRSRACLSAHAAPG